MEKDIFKQRRQMLADMILNNELYVPMKAKEIAMLRDIPKAKRSELMEVLDSLVADGTIGVSKKGKYMKPENVALVGTFESNRLVCRTFTCWLQCRCRSLSSIKLLSKSKRRRRNKAFSDKISSPP